MQSVDTIRKGGRTGQCHTNNNNIVQGKNVVVKSCVKVLYITSEKHSLESIKQE